MHVWAPAFDVPRKVLGGFDTRNTEPEALLRREAERAAAVAKAWGGKVTGTCRSWVSRTDSHEAFIFLVEDKGKPINKLSNLGNGTLCNP